MKDAGGALMSPADLAAAFHLKFTPVAEFNHQKEPTRSKVSGRTVLMIVLGLLVAAVITAAILLPEQRIAATNWLHTTLWQPIAKWFNEMP